MIALFLCNSASNLQRKSPKIKNNDNQIFYFIFCIFLKNHRVELSFQCRNEFYMPKYPNICIFMRIQRKKQLFPKFLPYYIMAMRRLWAKKLISTILTEFDVLPSKNHDSIVFLQNSASNFQRNSQKSKIMAIRYFILYFAIFSKTVGLSSVFSAEMNSACQNALITMFLWDLEKIAVFP